MDRSVRLTRDLVPGDIGLDDGATIQLEPRRLLREIGPAGLVEEDRTTRVDLSGLARYSAVGVEAAGCPEEAPTRRFGSARPRRHSAPASAALEVTEASHGAVSGVCTASALLPGEAKGLPPDARPAVFEQRSSVRGALQQDTVIVRRCRQGTDSLTVRILRGITVFAWGFTTATVLWIYLDRHPEWRAEIVDRLSSIWTSCYEKALK
ncbi:MAG: hypothetical protein JW889_13580 [Verrucomicrobia bacterium]|nr:hypothetical protein [Verrucomicrobiota bacterium]